MREIKFRAWDNDENVMHSSNECIVSFDEIGEDVYIKVGSSVKALYDYKLMQYTGLKDSNGKEIYEGDIVEIDDYFGENIIGRVIYDETDACYWFMKGDERNHLKMTFDLESYVHTVIGNIYENPELLG